MRSLRFAVVAAVIAVAALPLACDVQKTADQLAADRVMVATLLSTPPFDIRPSILNPDAGIDAGFDPDAGLGVTVAGQTGAFLFFGTRTSQSLDSAPSPISNATASLRPAGGTEVALANDGNGNYSLTSQSDESFQYQSGVNYDFVAKLDGVDYVGRIEEVPELERIAEFHPADGFISHPTGIAFTFTRPPPAAGKERNLGFVTVFPIGEGGQKGEPTYTNIPREPLDLLKLIALPGTFKTDTITIPGTAFPQTSSTYAVVFQAVKTGGAESNNLFTGSALLAGTAEIGLFRTR